MHKAPQIAPQAKKTRRLSRKAKGFVKDIVEGKTGVSAALNNYDTDKYNVANAIAVENLQKPAIRDAIDEALSDELIAKKHLEILEDDDGNVKAKGVDMAYKIKGKYAPEKRISANLDINKLQEEITKQIAQFRGLKLDTLSTRDNSVL